MTRLLDRFVSLLLGRVWPMPPYATVPPGPTADADVSHNCGECTDGEVHEPRLSASQRAVSPEVVVLPRHALFEFFGKMAFPPWRDEKGREIGGRIDCAAIASEITEWVETHDLTDLLPTEAGPAEQQAREVEDALRLTQEYVGDDLLPRLPGWTWWDAIGCNECGQPYVKWNPYNGVVQCHGCGHRKAS